MKAKQEINHIQVNFAWEKGNDSPVYLIRRVFNPLRWEIADSKKAKVLITIRAI